MGRLAARKPPPCFVFSSRASARCFFPLSLLLFYLASQWHTGEIGIWKGRKGILRTPPLVLLGMLYSRSPYRVLPRPRRRRRRSSSSSRW